MFTAVILHRALIAMLLPRASAGLYSARALWVMYWQQSQTVQCMHGVLCAVFGQELFRFIIILIWLSFHACLGLIETRELRTDDTGDNCIF